MSGPSLIANRRFPASTKLRLQLVFARASEALAETYQAQAAEFVRRLKPRLSIDEAFQRYFHEVGVPDALEGTVRARAMISLSGLIETDPRHEARAVGWRSISSAVLPPRCPRRRWQPPTFAWRWKRCRRWPRRSRRTRP